MRTTEKIVVLIVAFVLFAGGVYALSMEQGGGRTVVLGCIVAALTGIAIWVTLKRLKKAK